LILSRERLGTILSILGTSIGNKVMAVSYNVCFRVDRERNKLLLSTTDFHAYITIDYGDLDLTTLEDVPDIFLIDYKQINAIVKASTTENVEFVDGKGAHEHIKIVTNGEYKFTKWGSPDDFPQADFSYAEVAKWPVPQIKSAWSKAVVAISRDVTKIQYQGVNFDGNFAASDNRRLSVVMGQADYGGEAVLLPPVFGEVLKHCKNEVSVGPNTGGNMFIMVCEEIGLVASIRLIDANFQTYKAVFDKRKPGAVVTVPKQDILGAAARLMIFTDQLYKMVKIRVLHTDGDVSIELSITNKNAGDEIVEATDHDLNGASVQPGGTTCVAEFNYHLDNLLDGVSVTDDPSEVRLDFQEDGKLWIDEEHFHYLITRIQPQ